MNTLIAVLVITGLCLGWIGLIWAIFLIPTPGSLIAAGVVSVLFAAFLKWLSD